MRRLKFEFSPNTIIRQLAPFNDDGFDVKKIYINLDKFM